MWVTEVRAKKNRLKSIKNFQLLCYYPPFNCILVFKHIHAPALLITHIFFVVAQTTNNYHLFTAHKTLNIDHMMMLWSIIPLFIKNTYFSIITLLLTTTRRVIETFHWNIEKRREAFVGKKFDKISAFRLTQTDGHPLPFSCC